MEGMGRRREEKKGREKEGKRIKKSGYWSHDSLRPGIKPH